MPKKGFSLVEIVTVVLIIGILASIAISYYGKGAEKSRGAEARNTLMMIYRNVKVARVEDKNLTNMGPGTGDWASITMYDPNNDTNAWFAYWVNNTTNQSIAKRRTGSRPFTANTTAVDSNKWFNISLTNGTITTSSHY